MSTTATLDEQVGCASAVSFVLMGAVHLRDRITPRPGDVFEIDREVAGRVFGNRSAIASPSIVDLRLHLAAACRRALEILEEADRAEAV